VGRDDADLDPSDLFSDLMPGGRQAAGAIYPSGVARQEMLPADQPLFKRDSIPGRQDLNRGAAAAAGGDVARAGFDRASAIQHAADAIQRGADPDAVHARLIQMGQGDQEPPSPFSDLMPGGRPGTIADSAPPPMHVQPAFDDRGGLAPRAAAIRYCVPGTPKYGAMALVK
jgi:hypothetical protein